MADDDDPWIIQNIFDDEDDVIPGPQAAPAAGPVAQGKKRKRKNKSSKRRCSKRRKGSKRRRCSRRRY